jgi:hypothetical protein
MGEYFELIMSMVLAAALGAIAAASTVRYPVRVKSCAVAAALLWLYIMKEYYDWNSQELEIGSFFLPLLVAPLIAYGAQLLLGIVVLGMSFNRTRMFLTGHAGSGTA